MSGRAGRSGIDDRGESILLSTPGNLQKLAALMQAQSLPIASCLVEGKRGMKRAMLEVLASRAVATPEDINRYIRCTLLSATAADFQADVAKETKTSLRWLLERGFVTWDPQEKCYKPK